MDFTVEIRGTQTYPPYCHDLLTRLFADSKIAEIKKQFTEGQSGTFVFLVGLIDQNDEPMLPAIVKIGPSHLLEQERQAAQTYMVNRLADFVPISDSLVTVSVDGPDGAIADYSAARYALAGNGVFKIETLRNYTRTAPQDALWTVLEKRLFPQFNQIWSTRTAPRQRCVGATYDRVLPVNLRLEHTATIPETAIILDGTQDPSNYPLINPNDWVQFDNFVITEIETADHTLTLNRPQFNTQPDGASAETSSAYRLRIHNVANINRYKLYESVRGIAGRVTMTRQLLLQQVVGDALPPIIDLSQPFVQLPTNEIQLPNPLHHWQTLLLEELPMHISTVHGDLNTGNVLIDTEANTTFTIDCVHARRDHALYDLARLESEIVLHLVATRFYEEDLPPTAIHDLYNWLDFVTRRDPNPSGFFSMPQPLLETMPELQGAFIALTTIRNAARHYLAHPTQWREYYVAQTLTLFGSLKFATLDRAPAGMNPKAVAFWGAATLLAQLEQPANLMHIGWKRVTVHEVAAATESAGDRQSGVYVDYTDARRDQRHGTFFEGNESVRIEGDVINGGTVNKANFHGPVTGPIHTGSGNIHTRSQKEQK